MQFLLRLAVVVAVPSSLVALSTLTVVDELGAPTPLTIGATVGVFYVTAYALASFISSSIAHRAASRG